jgi:ABC-2 type transport system ATP-binding protein
MSSTEWLADKLDVPLLHVSGLTKRFGNERAIDGATFSAFPGEILGVIGPNGAGKTTLMETVADLLAADSGEVAWRGDPLPASRRRNVLFYLPDGVRPYRDQVTAEVVSFFAGVYRRFPDGGPRRCSVVWRKEKRIAVAFY